MAMEVCPFDDGYFRPTDGSEDAMACTVICEYINVHKLHIHVCMHVLNTNMLDL